MRHRDWDERGVSDILLCYAPRGRASAARLAAWLGRGGPARAPVRAALHEWELAPGADVLALVENALASHAVVGIVVSADLSWARWPRDEWRARIWQDPGGRRERVVPIRCEARDAGTGEPVDIPLPLWPLDPVDLAASADAEPQLARVARRVQGAPSDSEQGETLLGNLFRVRRHPARVWSDRTQARALDDLWDVFGGRRRYPYVLDGGRLYSFFPPDDAGNPFRALLTGGEPREERPRDWFGDPAGERRLLWLYNDAVREHAFRLGVRTPRRPGRTQSPLARQRFYCPTFDGGPRELRWSPDAPPRTLAKLARLPDGSALGAHRAARMRFITVAGDAYLHAEPGWLLTEDGVRPIRGPLSGVLSPLWGGRERNDWVLRELLTWGLLLSGGAPAIDVALGAETLSLDAVPAAAVVMGDAAGSGATGGDVGGPRPSGPPPLERVLAGAPASAAGGDDDLDRLIQLVAAGGAPPDAGADGDADSGADDQESPS